MPASRGPSIMFARNALCAVTEASRAARARQSRRDTAQAQDQVRHIDADLRSGRRLYLGDVPQDRRTEARRLRHVVAEGAAIVRRTGHDDADQRTARGCWSRSTIARSTCSFIIVRARNRSCAIPQIQVGGTAAGIVGRPGIWPDGFAQGAAGGGGFRDVPDVAAGASDAEILRFHPVALARRAMIAAGATACPPCMGGLRGVRCGRFTVPRHRCKLRI